MTKASSESAADLAGKLRAGDRRALARAITLIESTKPDHTGEAEALLEALLPFSGASVRIGISGVPGVGKSTFKIGRAQVGTPVTNAHIVCRLLLEKKKHIQ